MRNPGTGRQGWKGGYQRFSYQEPALDDLLGELITSPTMAAHEDKYTGHYAEYDVPLYFQRLVSSIHTLRLTLDNEKYWMHFYRITVALKEYHRILEENDLEKEIDLRIANLSTVIQTQIDIIIELKRTTAKQVQYVKSTRDLHNNLKVLVEKFKHAFNGGVDKRRFPPPEFKSPSLPPSTLLKWIDKIGAPPAEEAWWRMFGHAFYYRQKTAITSVSFFVFATGSGTQSLFDFLLLDIDRVAHTEASHTTHLFAHIGLPIIFTILAVATGITALILTKQHREEMRKEHVREVKAADEILQPRTATQPTLFQQQRERADSIHSSHSTEGFLIPTLETMPKEKVKAPTSPRLFGTPAYQSGSPTEKARAAYNYMLHIATKKPMTAWQPLKNTEQFNACATMRNYLIVGGDELLKRNIEELMDQRGIDRHIVYYR